MKKLLSLILVLSMIACLGVIFVACGDSGDSSDGDNNQSTTESNGSSTGSGNDAIAVRYFFHYFTSRSPRFPERIKEFPPRLVSFSIGIPVSRLIIRSIFA